MRPADRRGRRVSSGLARPTSAAVAARQLREAPEMRGLFVTGTGTEVGKTVVAAAIARTARAAGARVAVFKPAVSGLDDHPLGPRSGRARPSCRTTPCCGSRRIEQGDDEIAPYRYGPAGLSPPRRRAGRRADRSGPAARRRAGGHGGRRPAGLRGRRRLPGPADGGLPGPRPRPGPRRCRSSSSPRPGLGTINHTLLTIEAVRAAGLEVAAVVLTPWPDEPSAMERSNRETIARSARAGRDAPAPRPDPPERWPALASLSAPRATSSLRAA